MSFCVLSNLLFIFLGGGVLCVCAAFIIAVRKCQTSTQVNTNIQLNSIDLNCIVILNPSHSAYPTHQSIYVFPLLTQQLHTTVKWHHSMKHNNFIVIKYLDTFQLTLPSWPADACRLLCCLQSANIHCFHKLFTLQTVRILSVGHLHCLICTETCSLTYVWRMYHYCWHWSSLCVFVCVFLCGVCVVCVGVCQW